jgi:hypothetical protein
MKLYEKVGGKRTDDIYAKNPILSQVQKNTNRIFPKLGLGYNSPRWLVQETN